jgi:hypothetical protein
MAWPLGGERPLPGDQQPVPSQDRVGRHDGRDLSQDPAAGPAPLRREASTLIVAQPEAASRQLPLEDPVLLYQVFDDVLLVTVNPTRERHQQHLQQGVVGNHSPIVPCPTTDRWGATLRPAEFRTVGEASGAPTSWG